MTATQTNVPCESNSINQPLTQSIATDDVTITSEHEIALL